VGKYVRDRLQQLQGGGGKQKPPVPMEWKTTAAGRSEKERDKDRRLVHEMRDVYKAELKRSAGRALAGRRLTKREVAALGEDPTVASKRAKHSLFSPAAGYKRRERTWEDPAPSGKRRRTGPSPRRPRTAELKRRMSDDLGEEEWHSPKRARNFGPLPKSGAKRKAGPGLFPSAKRRNILVAKRGVKRKAGDDLSPSAAKRRNVLEDIMEEEEEEARRGSLAGRKRRQPMEEEYDEEELTGIPFKSRGVTFS
jgi:hypothetical protein